MGGGNGDRLRPLRGLASSPLVSSRPTVIAAWRKPCGFGRDANVLTQPSHHPVNGAPGQAVALPGPVAVHKQGTGFGAPDGQPVGQRGLRRPQRDTSARPSLN